MIKFALMFLAIPCFGSIANIYYGNASAGSNDGTSCANQYAWTDATNGFNVAGKWGAGGTQIGQDTIAHLCGTITLGVNATGLQFQGSGASGHPITLKWETGAVITSAAMQLAIDMNSKIFLVLDGGTNGTIQNTANGTGLAHSIDSGGVSCGGGHDVEIKNLSILNIYVRTGGSSDTNGPNSYGIFCGGAGSNMLIHNNTSTQSHAAIFLTWSGSGLSGWQIYSNITVGNTWGIACFAASSSDSNNAGLVHDNDNSDGTPWDDPADTYHKDAIFIVGQGGTTNGDSWLVYNNYMHGDWGPTHATAQMYINQSLRFFTIFNNVFSETGSTANGILTIGAGVVGFSIYNNTFVGSSGTTGGICIGETGGSTSTIIKNNIVIHCQAALQMTSSPSMTIDNNEYFDITGSGVTCAWNTNNNGCRATFTLWQAAGNDLNGASGDPLLNGSFKIGAGSPAIGIGANLTSLSISALDSDKAGVARPSSVAWDSGAYQSNPITIGLRGAAKVNVGGKLN